jgi:hypothetical protein
MDEEKLKGIFAKISGNNDAKLKLDAFNGKLLNYVTESEVTQMIRNAGFKDANNVDYGEFAEKAAASKFDYIVYY